MRKLVFLKILCNILILFVFCEVTFGQEKHQLIKLTDLPRVLKSQKHGEVIYIENGVYNDLSITIKNEKPIKILAESPGKVMLKGNTQLRLQSCDRLVLSGFYFDSTFSSQLIKLNKVTNTIIEDMLFKDSRGSSAYSRIIGINGRSSNNIIQNNTFDGIGTVGISIDDDNNVKNIITKNVFKNIPSVKSLFPDSDGNGMESIVVGRWDSDQGTDLFAEISNNYFENVEADGMEVICVKSNKNTIVNNYFTKCLGGISLRYGNDNLVGQNVFVNTGQNIRVFGDGHKIIENYIDGNRVGIQLPAANYIKGQKQKSTGYYRASNITLSMNVFKNMTTEPLEIGRNESNGRRRMPVNVIFETTDPIDKSFRDVLQQKRYRDAIKVSYDREIGENKELINVSNYLHGISWSK